jgi:hypothetical protein
VWSRYLTSVLELLDYICAAEAFNKGMTRDRCQECHTSFICIPFQTWSENLNMETEKYQHVMISK